ncbi:DUF418 domain-containing protein [Actinoplanes couchii]|uniref:DUF418 domain-containing protein n=1 Tax=Actinoplanes couchii TaxID=403638 RepID=A0ABQ3XRV7_9ACTN|nr:DUF418 domain-containing protein [Actinoplanes couchii]MDR6321460.1 putative membrane protein YeiB [Actinoplanes couchii]GID61132.1 hypothetical protein Aco03nite_095360 [Actinoplanes couchii]
MRIGPLPPAARALGPDLARGFMLLFIALANTHYFLHGTSYLGGYPEGGTVLDRSVVWILSTFVDGRSFPMFGLLFGYGVARIVQRQQDRGRPAVRRLLWRRSAILIAVGLADATLFYVGDILAAYGVLLLIGALMVFWRDRWLIVVAVVLLLLTSVPTADLATISHAGPDQSMLPTGPADMFTERPPTALFVAALGPLGFLCPFALGLWAGRRRILEHPLRHRRLLLTVAVAGIGAAVLGAQPIALLLSGVTTAPAQPLLEAAAALHDATGTVGGFGYAALFALVALRFEPTRTNQGPQDNGNESTRPPGAILRAVVATGQRSMSCYLMQSVTWAVVFTPFLLDLSGTLTVSGTALLAVATWATTVLIADLMRRSGRRGPFETLTRKVTYGGRPSPDTETAKTPEPATTTGGES